MARNCPIEKFFKNWGVSGLLSVVGLAYFVYAILFGVVRDDEEMMIAYASTTFHAKSLLQGTYPFWNPFVGFGVSHPFANSFIFHPLLPLFGFFPLGWTHRILYLLHGALAAWALVQLLNRWGVTKKFWPVGLLSFFLSSAALQYSTNDLWPVMWVMYTTQPVLYLAVVKLLEARNRSERIRQALWLGLVMGFFLLNTHPGCYVGYLFPFVLFFLADYRAIWRRRGAFCLAIVIALVLSANYLVPLFEELKRFSNQFRPPAHLPMAYTHWMWNLFGRPLSLESGAIFEKLLANGNRVVFFGGVFTVLGLVALLRPNVFRMKRHAGFTWAGLFCVLALPLSAHFEWTAYPLVYRDVIAFLLAGLVTLVLSRMNSRLAEGLGVCQAILLLLAAYPFLNQLLANARKMSNPLNDISRRGEIAEALLNAQTSGGGRIVFSRAVYENWIGRRMPLPAPGLFRNSGSYHGLRLILGTTKGISNDAIFPDEGLAYGVILPGDNWLFEKATAQALGARYLLAGPEEKIPAFWKARQTFFLPDWAGRTALTLYENSEKSATGWIFRGEVPTPIFPKTCEPGRLFCADYSDWPRLAKPLPETRPNPNRMSFRLLRSSEVQSLWISERWDWHWRARTDQGEPIALENYAGGFMVAKVPPGTKRVDLSYEPRFRQYWLGLSALVLLASLGLSWRVRKRSFEPRSSLEESFHL